MIFKELNRKNGAACMTVLLLKKQNTKNLIEHCFLERLLNNSSIFGFRRGRGGEGVWLFWTITQRKERDECVFFF
jgi:hypothetical protein